MGQNSVQGHAKTGERFSRRAVAWKVGSIIAYEEPVNRSCNHL